MQINKERIRILTGNSHTDLAQKIANNLGLELANATVNTFSNTETRVKIYDNIRKKHIYIIQTGSFTKEKSVNDYLMETFVLIDACKRSNAKSITVILPCYPYARQDKKDKARAPISASLVASFLQTAGTTRVMCIDLHADQIQGMFDVPVDNLSAEKYIVRYLSDPSRVSKLFYRSSDNFPGAIEGNSEYCVVSPDAGGAKRACAFAEKLKLPVVMIHKERNYNIANQVDKMTLVGGVGCVRNKYCFIIDDMADTCGTLCLAAKTLRENGANEVACIIVHGILSGPAIDRINKSTDITRVLVSNTLPQDSNVKKSDKICVFDISELLSDAIKAIATGGSISSLF